jgi:uncharacterized protein (TIGR03437 family)
MNQIGKIMRSLILFAIVTSAFAADPPVINPGGVVNSAGAPSVPAIAPGGLVSIFGSNLAASMTLSDSVPLSTTVGGVSVTINGVATPIQFAGPNQINVQVPWSVQVSANPGDGQVIVTNAGIASAAAPVTVASSAPAIYNIGGQAIAVNADGSLAAPANSIPGFATHPALIGDSGGLVIFATGLGAVDAAAPDGANSADQLRKTLAQPVVLVGGVPAEVTFSGLSPQFVGINQINIKIPAGTPTGNAVALQIQVGGTNSNLATIAVSQ